MLTASLRKSNTNHVTPGCVLRSVYETGWRGLWVTRGWKGNVNNGEIQRHDIIQKIFTKLCVMFSFPVFVKYCCLCVCVCV